MPAASATFKQKIEKFGTGHRANGAYAMGFLSEPNPKTLLSPNTLSLETPEKSRPILRQLWPLTGQPILTPPTGQIGTSGSGAGSSRRKGDFGLRAECLQVRVSKEVLKIHRAISQRNSIYHSVETLPCKHSAPAGWLGPGGFSGFLCSIHTILIIYIYNTRI